MEVIVLDLLSERDGCLLYFSVVTRCE